MVSVWNETVLLIPNLATLVAKLMADERVPGQAKASLAGIGAYLAMPFDLIPDFIPILGHLDDLVVVILLIDGVLNQIDEKILMEYWEGAPATLQRLKRMSKRVSCFIPSRIKRKLFGSCPRDGKAAR
jgi:uncharacterized membrane protein YkvA (DUF1232 family)